MTYYILCEIYEATGMPRTSYMSCTVVGFWTDYEDALKAASHFSDISHKYAVFKMEPIS